jgi:hypothetical protein
MRGRAFDASRAKFGYIIRDFAEQVSGNDLNMFCFLHSRPSTACSNVSYASKRDEGDKGEGGCEGGKIC